MAFTYDPATDRGYVRLLLGDTNLLSEIFSDAEIDAYLSRNDDAPLLAAAAGADAIGASELMIQKVITILDLKTDGAKVAAEWRQKAIQWRDLYESGQAADDEALEAFDWAEIAYDPFSARERVRAQALRA